MVPIRRREHARLMTALRYPMLLPTYGLFVPTIRVLNRMGRSSGILTFVNNMLTKQFQIDKSFAEYHPTPHDVFVCVYFKSGTNWMMQITHQIATRGQGEYDHIHDVIPWPDGMPGMSLDVRDETPWRSSPTGLRVIKTHLAMEHVPYSPKARYICVIRDPKDVAVSGYHFMRDTSMGVLMPYVPEFLETFLDENFLFGCWGKHLHSYWQERHHDNVLFLEYAKIKQDLPGTVRRVADFMGVSLSEEEFGTVCRKSSFEYMSTINHKFFPGILSPWSAANGRMMREGKVGSGAKFLTPEQQKHIDEHFSRRLQEIKSDFPYHQTFGTKAANV